MDGHLTAFVFLGVVCGVVGKYTESLSNTAITMDFREFQQKFLTIYVVMVSADWLQGPYVYKLYSFYGFTKGEIGFLFVSGYAASAVFGTFVGGLADQVGRKKACILYCIFYGMACLTKHTSEFYVLLVGRILAGISTSILQSCFEAWMMHEHKRLAYPDEWLNSTLYKLTFLNGLSAITSGVVSSFMVGKFGYVAPFDISLVCLIIGAVLVQKSWGENYGDRSTMMFSNFPAAWNVIATNPKVSLLGMVQSFFEGAMYIFVFSWTPILESSDNTGFSHGIVFACFMVSLMIGSFGFKFLVAKTKFETYIPAIYALSGVLLAVPAFSDNKTVLFIAFCLYEVCVGFYFPTISYFRSRFVPNETRATVTSIFRLPLNVIVVMVLLNVSHMKMSTVSLCCTAMSFASAAAQQFLLKISSRSGRSSSTSAGTKALDPPAEVASA